MDQEQKWIRAIVRRGSREASDQLVRRYYDEVYAFIYRQVGDREDALDLTQESFIAALRALPSFDRRKSKFRTWLYSIATHKVIDARRKFTPLMVPLESEALTAEGDFVRDIADKALLEQIETHVCTLDPEVQTIYRLRLYGEYSFPEIAAAVCKPESNVKAAYYRLLKQLRKEFSP